MSTFHDHRTTFCTVLTLYININVLYIVLFNETLYGHVGCNLQDVQVLIKKSVQFKFLKISHNLTTYLSLIHYCLRSCQELFIYIILFTLD